MGKEMIENEVAISEAAEDETLVVVFVKPYKFEGKEYAEIDLSALEDISAADMIEASKIIKRTSGGSVDVMPEVTLEYACVLSAQATKMPIEFFTGLPPREAMKVKNKVMGFLFGQD